MNYHTGRVFSPTEGTKLWARPYRAQDRRPLVPLFWFDGKAVCEVHAYLDGRVLASAAGQYGWLG